MKCPACERGIIKKIAFRSSQKKGWVCEVCETVWFEDEVITQSSGHPLAAYTKDQDINYEIEDVDEKDQDHQVVVQEAEKYTVM